MLALARIISMYAVNVVSENNTDVSAQQHDIKWQNKSSCIMHTQTVDKIWLNADKMTQMWV